MTGRNEVPKPVLRLGLPALVLGLLGCGLLWAWERVFGLPVGAAFIAVVGFTVVCGLVVVAVFLRWIAMDQRAAADRRSTALPLHDTRPADDYGASRAGGRDSAAGGSSVGGGSSRLLRVAEAWLGAPPLLRLLGELVPGVLVALVLLWIPSRPDDEWVGPVASLLVCLAFSVAPVRRFRVARSARRPEGKPRERGGDPGRP